MGENLPLCIYTLNITRPTLYRYVDPTGQLREFGKKVLEKDV